MVTDWICVFELLGLLSNNELSHPQHEKAPNII